MHDPLSAEQSVQVSRLVHVFTRIGDERMKEIGLYNHALAVEAVGWRRWDDQDGRPWLAGILITPWFMNFILLPAGVDQLAGAEVTTKRQVAMACGEVLFTVGDVEEIGPYLSASLFSPMDRFDVQGIAVASAWAAVERFFRTPEENGENADASRCAH